jgi:hypothetical protein
MTDQTPKMKSGMTDPQVLTALITGIVSVVVAVVGLVPTILSANAPTPTATLMPTLTYTSTTTPNEAVTLTIEPPTSEPASPTPLPPTTEPTATTEIVVAQGATSTPRPLEPLATDVPPTVEPTVEQVVVEENLPNPNVLLIFDDVSFTVVNVSGGTLSLDGIRFRSDSGKWDVKRWGGKSVYGALPDDKCLRLRDSAAGNRNPPGECRDLHALHITGGDAIFWRNVSEFEIRSKKDTIATCKTDTDRCAIYIPQD